MKKIHQWTSEQVKQFWDYESRYPLNYWSRANGRSLLNLFRKELNNCHSILDFGCGDGGLIQHLLQFTKSDNKEVYGFDPSVESINKINKQFKGKKTFKGGFTTINDLVKIKSEFDFIFCCEVVEHVYEKDLNEILQNAYRLLTKNGKLLVTTPNDEDLEKSYILNPIDGSVFHRWQHVRSWSADTLADYLKLQNYNVLNKIETNIGYYDKFPKNILRRIFRKTKPNLFILCKK
jgi:2-polyprenyl-3-methyl-5-hydroxy-6-metoxy-1,4-benzoquinol methylase